MIVCSCNVFSDHDIRRCLAAATPCPRAVGEVYARLGHRPCCGRCARTILAILREDCADPCAICPAADIEVAGLEARSAQAFLAAAE